MEWSIRSPSVPPRAAGSTCAKPGRRRVRAAGMALIGLAASVSAVSAQNGIVTGRITQEATGRAIASVQRTWMQSRR